jgi:hypothetical protein
MFNYRMLALPVALLFIRVPMVFSFMTVPKTVVGSGVLISKAFVLDTKYRFTSIRIDGIGSVEIKVGSTNQIVVEAEDNVMPRTLTIC